MEQQVTKQEVKGFLERSFPGEVELETLPSGRISGHLVWEGFTGQDQVERQGTVRNALRGHFNAGVQDISVLLTYTPTEMKEMLAA